MALAVMSESGSKCIHCVVEAGAALPCVVETSAALPCVVETGAALPCVVEAGAALPCVVETGAALPCVVEAGAALPCVVEAGAALPCVVEAGAALPCVVEAGAALPCVVEAGAALPCVVETGAALPCETVEKVKNSVKAMYGEMRALLEQDEQNTYRLIEAEHHNMLRQIHSQVNGGFDFIEAAMNVVENVEHMVKFQLTECEIINILMEVNSMKISVEMFEAIHKSFGKDIQVDNKRLKSLENCVDEILKSTKKFLPRPWQYSENITFDENTAHRNLRVTEDRREIRFVSEAQSVLEKPERFTKTPNVMATQIFSSGRHYWEVMLKGKENWGVGVAYPTMPRTGTRRDMTLGFNKESWVFQLSDGEFYAMHNGDAIHQICKKFHRLGVFLDYEDGKLSFYAVDNFCLLYTFKTKFRKPVTPAFKTYDKSSTWPLVLCPMLPEPKEPVSDIGEPNPTEEDSVSYFSERL
ncbi:UNVERIFIED_CONTAM: hypothetical protein FKN15_002939 [Acipenser sinensis]